MFDSLWPHGLYSPWNFPVQNTGVGSRSHLQGIFQTQKSNWGLPVLQVDSLPAELPGKLLKLPSLWYSFYWGWGGKVRSWGLEVILLVFVFDCSRYFFPLCFCYMRKLWIIIRNPFSFLYYCYRGDCQTSFEESSEDTCWTQNITFDLFSSSWPNLYILGFSNPQISPFVFQARTW